MTGGEGERREGGRERRGREGGRERGGREGGRETAHFAVLGLDHGVLEELHEDNVGQLCYARLVLRVDGLFHEYVRVCDVCVCMRVCDVCVCARVCVCVCVRACVRVCMRMYH